MDITNKPTIILLLCLGMIQTIACLCDDQEQNPANLFFNNLNSFDSLNGGISKSTNLGLNVPVAALNTLRDDNACTPTDQNSYDNHDIVVKLNNARSSVNQTIRGCYSYSCKEGGKASVCAYALDKDLNNCCVFTLMTLSRQRSESGPCQVINAKKMPCSIQINKL